MAKHDRRKRSSQPRSSRTVSIQVLSEEPAADREAEPPGRGRGDGASRLAAGPGVAAGAGRDRQAHAQARPGHASECCG